MNAVQKSGHPWQIVRVPGICGGEPIVQGTRIPVKSIVVQWMQYRGVDRVRNAFPRLDSEAVQCALDYYANHTAEIDQLIQESEQAANATT